LRYRGERGWSCKGKKDAIRLYNIGRNGFRLNSFLDNSNFELYKKLATLF
jgi:hypothetical protein